MIKVGHVELSKALQRSVAEQLVLLKVFSAHKPETRETVQRYRAHLELRNLSPSSLNVYLSALRRLAREGAASGLLSQEQAAAVASVPGVRQKGRRLGAWLSLEQAQTLLVAPAGEGLKAIRDRALLARAIWRTLLGPLSARLLIGCGLRRDELAHITVEQIQKREGRWVLVDIDGKGRRLRSVPMPGWTKARIDLWTARLRHFEWTLIPRRDPGRGSRRGRDHSSGGVFNCERICRAARITCCSPRSAPHFRPARSPRPLAPRTNTAVARALVHPDDRTLPRRSAKPHRRPLRSLGNRGECNLEFLALQVGVSSSVRDSFCQNLSEVIRIVKRLRKQSCWKGTIIMIWRAHQQI